MILIDVSDIAQLSGKKQKQKPRQVQQQLQQQKQIPTG
jgi:hypothetical protein